MAVTRLQAIIGVYAACGVLIVAITAVTVYLLCRRRARSKAIDDDANGGEKYKYYAGFSRRCTFELTADPPPGVYRDCVLVTMANSKARAHVPFDILIHVEFTDMACGNTDTTGVVIHDGAMSAGELLGNDSYYDESFLLYTAPLEFARPGTYTILAHTVYPHERVVGAVHRFVYVVSFDPHSLTDPSRLVNDINVSLSRHSGPLVSQRPPSSALPCPKLPVDGAAAYPHGGHQAGHGIRAPSIIPSGGEVTTATDIFISPSSEGPAAGQMLYSVDGTYPSRLYTGPFKLSLPSPELLPKQRLRVTIKAIAVTGLCCNPPDGATETSPLAQTVLTVFPAGYSYYDPVLPAPTLRLRAVDAQLYFDETQNIAGSLTCYRILSVHDARRKIKFSRQRCAVYDGTPIPLADSVARICAWTVSAAAWRELERQRTASANGGLNHGGDDADDEERIGSIQRSAATIYDCTRGSTEHDAQSQRAAGRGLNHLPSPIICVSCKEMEVEFDNPPADGKVAYTLDGSEPILYDVNPPAGEIDCTRRKRKHRDPSRHALNTFLYETGKPLRITLLETKGIALTARIFLPIRSGAEGSSEGLATGGHQSDCRLLGYRYSDKVSRSFYFYAGDGSVMCS